jgi:hypothetical protein
VDEQFEYQFEWDPSKAQRNAREHKVTFEEAVEVFSDADALSQYDTEQAMVKIAGLHWGWIKRED